MGVALNALVAMFGVNLTEERAFLYLRELQDLPHESLMKALKRCLRECDTFPSVRTIREKAGEIVNESRTAAEVAFESVIAYKRKFGSEWPLPEFYTRLMKDADGEYVYRTDSHGVFAVQYVKVPVQSFDERTTYAIDSVGGLSKIEPTDEYFALVKKDFIAAHEQYEAARNMKQLAESVNVKRLAASKKL